MKYLNKEENLDTFKSFVKINYYSIYTMQNVDRKEILETIQKRILNEQKKIAEILSGIDNLISSLKVKIKKHEIINFA